MERTHKHQQKIINRIQQMLRDSRMSQKELGEIIGVDPTSISHYLSGNREISDGFLYAISCHLSINPLWLETGKGEMLLNTEAQQYSEVSIEFAMWLKDAVTGMYAPEEFADSFSGLWESCFDSAEGFDSFVAAIYDESSEFNPFFFAFFMELGAVLLEAEFGKKRKQENEKEKIGLKEREKEYKEKDCRKNFLKIFQTSGLKPFSLENSKKILKLNGSPFNLRVRKNNEVVFCIKKEVAEGNFQKAKLFEKGLKSLKDLKASSKGLEAAYSSLEAFPKSLEAASSSLEQTGTTSSENPKNNPNADSKQTGTSSKNKKTRFQHLRELEERDEEGLEKDSKHIGSASKRFQADEELPAEYNNKQGAGEEQAASDSEPARPDFAAVRMNYRSTANKTKHPFIPAYEIDECIQDLESCADRIDRLVINQIWEIAGELTDDTYDEDGNVTGKEDTEGYTFPADRLEKDIVIPAIEAAAEMVENRSVTARDGREVKITATMPENIDELFDIVDWKKIKGTEGTMCVISKDRFRDISRTVSAKKKSLEPTREEKRAEAKADLAYMGEIIRLGKDSSTIDQLTPIEYAAYIFLSDNYEIDRENNEIVDMKVKRLNRDAMMRFQLEIKEEGVNIDDFLGILSVDKLCPYGSLGLRTRMFSADKIRVWNETNNYRSSIG